MKKEIGNQEEISKMVIVVCGNKVSLGYFLSSHSLYIAYYNEYNNSYNKKVVILQLRFFCLRSIIYTILAE